MIKNFVLDTNVLLHDPNALFHFEDNRVIIPITVIEELDHFKKDQNMLGRNARTVSKHIDRLRVSGNLGEGVELEHGGVLRVAFGSEGASLLPPELEGRTGDNRILGVALSARAREKDVPVVVVTKDTNLRIKADALGITAEDYESDRVDIEELYRGFREVNVGKEFIDAFYAAGECLPPPDARDLHPNEYIILRDFASQSSALGRADALRRKIRL
ncbi:MAG TPA: PIN domain-containing protein, partial [Candidatus Deferrimicrobium sp.]